MPIPITGTSNRVERSLVGLLESFFHRYHHPEYISPDPLEYVLRFPRPADREVAGLIASALAYGGVKQIGASVERVFSLLGPAPASRLDALDRPDLEELCEGFRHRWTTGAELADLLWGAREVRRRFGSLGECFRSHLSARDPDVLPALSAFVTALRGAGELERNSLLSEPSRGSACKRLHLYLRWMVRKDEVDPGGWEGVPAAKLIVPVDTHMHRVGHWLRFTRRRQADARTAREITEGFRALCPADPARYDFALTRPGIRKDPVALEGLRRLSNA